MDLLNMTKRAKSMNFTRRLNGGNFYLSSYSFEFWLFLLVQKFVTNAKFQLNMFKIMPARPKNTGTWGVTNTLKKYKLSSM